MTDMTKQTEALREAQQPAPATELREQEPVYFCDYGYEGWGKVDADMAAANIADGMTVEAYYTSPPAQPSKPLTDEQMADFLGCRYHTMSQSDLEFFRLGEAAHGVTGEQK